MKLRAKKKLIISSGLVFDKIDAQVKTQLKEKLTFDNPAYLSAVRYSKYPVTRIPPYLTYGKRVAEGFRVPIGTDLDSLVNVRSSYYIEDRRIDTLVKYPPFLLELRRDQQRAYMDYMRSQNKKYCAPSLIQLPTGKGKTVLGLYIASQLEAKTLIICHKTDLVVSWKQDIEQCFGGKVTPGLIKAKERRVGNTITIATYQTLNRLTPKELEELYNTFSLVICDECHRCAASCFGLVDNFNSRFKLGLTATPERSDGLTDVLHLYFGGFAFTYKNSGFDEDILQVEVYPKEIPIEVNAICQHTYTPSGASKYRLKQICTPKNPLSDGEVFYSDIPYNDRPRLQHQDLDSFIVSMDSFKKQVIQDVLKEYNKGHSCVLFFSQIKNLMDYYETLHDALGDTVETYYGGTKDIQGFLSRAENRECLVTLTTYSKASEGTNVKSWEVGFFVSSIKDEKNVEQSVGRIRRTKEGKLPVARLYDYYMPNAILVKNHFNYRLGRYFKLGFKVHGYNHTERSQKKSLFNKGYV